MLKYKVYVVELGLGFLISINRVPLLHAVIGGRKHSHMVVNSSHCIVICSSSSMSIRLKCANANYFG